MELLEEVDELSNYLPYYGSTFEGYGNGGYYNCDNLQPYSYLILPLVILLAASITSFTEYPFP